MTVLIYTVWLCSLNQESGPKDKIEPQARKWSNFKNLCNDPTVAVHHLEISQRK